MTPSSHIRIRPARSADAALIAQVDKASGIVHEPHVPALIQELLVLGMSLIAEAAYGGPAGYAIVSKRFFSRPFIDLLAVAPAFRRQGVGAALLEACSAATDDDHLFTSTNRSNAPMRALLAKCGFGPSGVIDNLDPGDPELVYVRLLGKSTCARPRA